MEAVDGTLSYSHPKAQPARCLCPCPLLSEKGNPLPPYPGGCRCLDAPSAAGAGLRAGLGNVCLGPIIPPYSGAFFLPQ